MSRTRFGWAWLSMLFVWSCSGLEPTASREDGSAEIASIDLSLESNCTRGTDVEPVNSVDDCDEDADSDGVSNKNDIDDNNASRCWDEDADTCDDCARGVDGAGPKADNVPANDGVDTDFDGKCDAGDLDDDDDGVCDSNQSATGCRAGPDSSPLVATRCLDTDADLCDDCSSGKFNVKKDGADGNGDGKCDLSDDADKDGVIDTTDLDADGDGIPDARENLKSIDPDADADKDSIPNQWDSDNRGDGQPNACNDKNGDGRCDSTGLYYDTDNDDVPNHLDLDADGDGLKDAAEDALSTLDTDNDGRVDGALGENGLLDALETSADSGTRKRAPIDTDGDGSIDALDTDSDGDTALDQAEGVGDADKDGIPDAYDRVNGEKSDSDSDGYTDAAECPAGRPCPDVDADSVPDYTTPDEDGDGVASAVDLDDDNDGILDSVEGEADQDMDSVVSRVDLDSDGDGIKDVDEARTSNVDANRDGRVDGSAGKNGVPDAVESSPESGSVNAPVDTDGDTFADYIDLDADGDGAWDKSEIAADGALRDSDSDLTPDYRDTDDDNDGIPTRRELTVEGQKGAMPDNDNLPAYLDADSDGDGRSDKEEGDNDKDGNGVADFLDARVNGPDSDGDGYLDEMECAVTPCRDLDRDGAADLLDADDDGDGVPTVLERTRDNGGDTDGDGTVDAYDDDDDDDGVKTSEEGNVGDTDEDGTPDPLDDDDDGDGVPTRDELDLDSDDDGVEDRLSEDDDGDGVPTKVERDALSEEDLDGDELPQHRDADDDGDGLSTRAERPNGEDQNTDEDDFPNHYDADDDDDGVDTSEERPMREDRDTDSDGLADHLDADDDGDGIETQDEGEDDDGNDVPDYLEEPGAGGTFGGAALCSATPAADAGAGSLGVLLLLAAAWLFRRRALRALGLLALLLLLPHRSNAQVAVEQFRPALLKEDGFGLARPVSLDGGRLSVAFLLDYAREPLVYERPDSKRKPELAVIENHLVGHAGLSLGLGHGLTLTGSVPMHLVMRGEDPGPITPAADDAGVGDVALMLRSVFADGAHFGMSGEFTARLPTADLLNEDQTYSGDEVGSYEPGVIFEARAGKFDARAKVGARFRKPVELRNFELGQELVYGAGARLQLSDSLYAHLEVTGSSAFKHFGKDAYSPLESLLGLKYEGPSLYAGLGAGPGLLSGYGSPSVRAVATIGYVLAKKQEPTLFRKEPPPKAPEPPPDRDGDGVLDAQDRCAGEAEDRDGFEDEDGCPDLDQDGDGIADAQDRCAQEPEDKDGFEDDDGCPDLDDDKDGVPDASDECPKEAGTPDAKGCAPKAIVEQETKQIRITERVEFETGSDDLLETSSSVLNAVAEALAAHPELKKIRVEGHADSRARDRLNMRLSKKRAAAVVRWLVSHGVSENRVEGFGCGENRPIESGDSEEAMRKNRRVEFHIVDQGKKPPEDCEPARVKNDAAK